MKTRSASTDNGLRGRRFRAAIVLTMSVTLGLMSSWNTSAQGEWERLPDMPVESFRLFLPAAILERFFDGWRKAGWKE